MGKKASEETKTKMREAHKKRKELGLKTDYGDRSGKNNPMYGKTQS